MTWEAEQRIAELEAKLDRINEARELAAARYADWTIPTNPVLSDLLMVLDVELSG